MEDDYLEGALADLGRRLSVLTDAIARDSRKLDLLRENVDRVAIQLLKLEQKVTLLDWNQRLGRLPFWVGARL